MFDSIQSSNTDKEVKTVVFNFNSYDNNNHIKAILPDRSPSFVISVRLMITFFPNL